MDDAVANRMRARVQEGARSVEVWEVVRTFRVYVETDDGRAGMVTVQVQQSDAGWMVLAHGPDGREVGLSNPEASWELALDVTQWHKLEGLVPAD